MGHDMGHRMVNVTRVYIYIYNIYIIYIYNIYIYILR